MPDTTHLFFDLFGVLVDREKLHDCYCQALGRIMADRYGLQPETWTAAYRQVVADWDSYHADLDFGGDDGLADMREGRYRTTRALFLTANIPEPPHTALQSLARWLPVAASQQCDGAYPGIQPALMGLVQRGYTLNVIAQLFADRVRGILTGAGLIDAIRGAVITPDAAEHFHQDAAFFRYAALVAQANPAQCLVISKDDDLLAGAQAAGFQAACDWSGLC